MYIILGHAEKVVKYIFERLMSVEDTYITHRSPILPILGSCHVFDGEHVLGGNKDSPHVSPHADRGTIKCLCMLAEVIQMYSVANTP